MDGARKKSAPAETWAGAQREKSAGQGKVLDWRLGGWSNQLTFLEHASRARHYSKHLHRLIEFSQELYEGGTVILPILPIKA